ncbi:MAG: hypothetical protein R3190_03095, partial [Thermoanaerobaculia bacterium]|nr:hypothetical protein [Thermoanaerobaculia bacterium]
MPLAAPALAAILVAAQPPAREPRPASPALPEEEILGTPADWAIAGDAADRATVELAVGTELLEEPAPGAPVVAIFPGGRLPVWTTRLGWAQVIWDDVVAWVEIDPPEPPAAIELDAGPPPASPVGGDD